MNFEYIALSRKKRFDLWIGRRLAEKYARDTGLWRFAVASMWLLSCVAVAVAAMGMPTGFGSLLDVVTGIALHTMAMAFSSALLTIVLAITGARVPRFTVGSFVYMNVLVFFILYYSEFGWKGALVYSLLYSFAAAGLGLLTWSLSGVRIRGRRRYVVVGATSMVVLVMVGFYVKFGAIKYSADRADSTEVQAQALRLPDPSKPGEYAYRSFTYGIGEDRHRAEYGDETDELSVPVDASDYIESWPWLRDKFWGFDEKRLPLNGRVWMPEGNGPFPLVLMVHGNHLMEKFSDEGYGYIGELLASRGMIAISIDENFLNYSVWSGIPKEDMKLRAWLLLQHVRQLQAFSRQKDSSFHGRVDFGRMAMLGHSRGGQAATMAADRNRWFPEDKSLPIEGSYSIQAVVALAPTDTVVDGKRTELKDISYLTLQGAKDADLVNFYGDRQYGRVTFSPNSEAFKASLYIEDANHSQFNTMWGSSDNAWPTGLFVRPSELLAADDQRQVAEAYVSGFLEATLQHNEEYEPLFLDYRTGLSFLPHTRYSNQYESGRFERIADFSGKDRTTLSRGVTAEATGLTDWRLAEALDRQGKGKGDQGVLMEWKSSGSYSILLNSSAVKDLSEDDVLMFSLANLEQELEDELLEGMGSSIDVEVEDRSGNAVKLPLSQFMETERQGATQFTWLPGMEGKLSKGKFKGEKESVFQSFGIPLEAFMKHNHPFHPSELSRVTLYYNGGPGKVMLDDLGWMRE